LCAGAAAPGVPCGEGGEGDGRCGDRRRCVPKPSPARAAPGLFDQSFEVVRPFVLASARRLWWCSNGHRNEATMNSTMLRVKVDRGERTVLHEQVAAEIRRAIAEGEALPGERVPPARDLAAVLGVNTNTVLRALRQLRDEGLLEFRRGRGITVTGSAERGAVLARARALVHFAREHGYRIDEVVEMIEDVA
jgi:GntR family transcriptional regulator